MPQMRCASDFQIRGGDNGPAIGVDSNAGRSAALYFGDFMTDIPVNYTYTDKMMLSSKYSSLNHYT